MDKAYAPFRDWLRPGRHIRLLVAFALVLMVGATGIAAAGGRTFRGLPLIEALTLLQERGLHLVYSSAVVDEKTRVTIEPDAIEPRAMLEEILAPLGLAAIDGPGGALLIEKAPLKETTGTVRGRVVSTVRGSPIVGATLIVTGTQASSTTRPDGTFELPAIDSGVHEIDPGAGVLRENIERHTRARLRHHGDHRPAETAAHLS